MSKLSVCRFFLVFFEKSCKFIRTPSNYNCAIGWIFVHRRLRGIMRKTLTAVFTICLIVFGALNAPAQRTGKSRISPANTDAKAMQFDTANAYTDGNGVWVTWQLTGDARALGFNVYRIGAEGRELLTTQPVVGSAADRGFYFPEGRLGDAFEVEGIRFDGTRFSSQRFGAEQVGHIEDVSGRTADDMAAVNTSNGNIERSDLILPAELTEGAKTAQRPNLANQRALAAQAGVKIGIRKDGFYRVSKSELMAAGFDTATDRTKWQLFGNGVEQAIIVEPAGNYIEFYAKAINTIESDTRYFFLLNGTTAGKRIGTRVSRPVSGAVVSKNYQNRFSLSQKNNYIFDILNGDAENYWGSIIQNGFPVNVNFNLSGIDMTQSKALMNVSFQGFSTTPHGVDLSLNGHSLGTVNGNSQSPFSADFLVQTSFLNEGQNTLTASISTSGDLVMFDTVKIDFARKYLADQNRTAFYSASYRRSTVGGFTSQNVRLFDTTVDGDPVQVTGLSITQNGPTYDINLPAYRSRVFYAVEDSAALTAASVIPNYASSLATPAHNATLVILSYRDFMTQAENWANYRRGQGISVEVVDVDDAYDEFNFGMAGSDPVTAFLSYAKSNWQTPPQYVLFLGDASYDPKNYEGRGYQNLIPSRMVNTVYIETGSDEALCDFNGDGLAEIAVGRIPAKLPIEVSNALAKVMAFETAPMQDLNRGAVLACDVPNGYDFCGMSDILRSQLPQTMPVSVVRRGLLPPNEMTPDPNGQANLLAAINDGKYLVNYSGHGTTGAWVNTGFFSVNNFNGAAGFTQVSNLNRQSIFVMLTCLNGYFMNPYNDSLAELMLRHTNGGSVAAWASTGKTTPDIQLAMAERFYQQVSLGNIVRLGDLIKDAKTQVAGGADVRLSWALLGDPMLKVR